VASDRAAEYRRLAQECVNLARTVSTGETRDQFMLMAQVWLRLAEEQEPRLVDGPDVGPPPQASGEAPPAVQQQQVQQQQQQPQPKDDADGS
jgi:hypothetical protein